MAEAERASVYYRTLCRNYVEPKHAEQITCAWILGHINADAARRLPRAPWDLDGDAP